MKVDVLRDYVEAEAAKTSEDDEDASAELAQTRGWDDMSNAEKMFLVCTVL